MNQQTDSLPAPVLDKLRQVLGESPKQMTYLTGGCVAEVHAFQAAGERWVIKIDRGDSGVLACEGRMLRYLDQHSSLPVPAPVVFDNSFLLMPYMPGASHWDGQAECHAAELLAEMHNQTMPCFGFSEDTVIGGLPQPNPKSSEWMPFFRDYRLLGMAHQAFDAGRLPLRVYQDIERLAAKLDQLLPEPDHPALLHGDIWSGNILAHNGRITAFLDPAIYWGDPQMELAFIDMFDTFGDSFFSAYDYYGLIDDTFWTVQCPLYQLYPLLVHARLFGGSYVDRITQTLRRFVD